MVRILFVLGMVGAAVAESSYTGPMFNPSSAAFFGPSGLVFPTLTGKVPTTVQTPTFIRSFTSAASISDAVSATGSASRSPQTSASQSRSLSSAVSSSASPSITSSASRSSSPTSSASAPAQSTGAAALNGPVVMGAIAGGLIAGLAMW